MNGRSRTVAKLYNPLLVSMGELRDRGAGRAEARQEIWLIGVDGRVYAFQASASPGDFA
jgi:hypothetical protein